MSDDTIRQGCAAIVARHPPLRTTIRLVDAEPRLHLHPVGELFAFDIIDVDCAVGSEHITARAWARSAGKRRWDLTTDAPIHFSLLRHDDQRRTLVIAVHHIGFDGRSKFIFAHEFAAVLTRFRSDATTARNLAADEPSPLPPGHWQVPQPAVDAAREYWSGLDPACLEPLNLPEVWSPSEHGVGTTDNVDCAGPHEIRRLEQTCAAAGTTFFGGLVAAVGLHLYEYDNRHVVLSIPVDTRTPEQAGSIGLAVNTVAVHIPVTSDGTLLTVLAAVRTELDRLRRFRRVPLASIMRGQSLASGFRCLIGRLSVSYLDLPDKLPSPPGLAIAWDLVAPNSSQSFDLMMHFRRGGGRLLGRVDYRRAVADARVARQFIAGFAGVLSKALADPDRPLRDLLRLPATGTALRQPVTAVGRPGPIDREAWLRQRMLIPRHVVVPELTARSPAELTAHLDGQELVAVATVRAALPALVAALCDGALGDRLKRVILPVTHLRGGPLVRELIRRGVVVWGRYALAPAGLIAAGPETSEIDLVPSWPMAPGAVITVIGSDAQVLPMGVAGELTVAGLGPPVRSGHLVRVDGRGALRYLGTTADVIRWGGLVVNPYVLERRLCGYPGVHDAAVVARAGTRGVHAIAYVVGEEQAVARLRSLLRRDLGRDAVIPIVEQVDELPFASGGDVDRPALRDRMEGRVRP